MLRKYLSLALGLASIAAAGSAAAADFRVTSTSVAEGVALAPAQVFRGFGCDGGDRSPHLAWTGAPSGTRSFAITAYDPDAPTGSGWWHWNVVNIPADVAAVPEGASREHAMPKGAMELRNDYGVVGFGGACPPPGEVHRYIFTVHALGVEKLDIPKDASNALAGYMIHANAIAEAGITAVHTR